VILIRYNIMLAPLLTQIPSILVINTD